MNDSLGIEQRNIWNLQTIKQTHQKMETVIETESNIG